MVSSVTIMRNGVDVTKNYEITSTPGTLTINQAEPTVNSWPTAGEITYGQALVNADTLTAAQLSATGTDAGTYPHGITVTGAKIENGGTDVTANYAISYAAGTLTIDPATITVTPDSGYALDTLTVTDSRGNEVRLSVQNNGKYTFTMPGRAVTIKAVFVPLPDGTACDGGEDCPSRGFTDLSTVGIWYHEAVDYVLRNDLMDGYGNGLFGPNDTLTRAQFVQILFNKEGRPPERKRHRC